MTAIVYSDPIDSGGTQFEDGEQINAMFDTVRAVVNGGLGDVNLAARGLDDDRLATPAARTASRLFQAQSTVPSSASQSYFFMRDAGAGAYWVAGGDLSGIAFFVIFPDDLAMPEPGHGKSHLRIGAEAAANSGSSWPAVTVDYCPLHGGNGAPANTLMPSVFAPIMSVTLPAVAAGASAAPTWGAWREFDTSTGLDWWNTGTGAMRINAPATPGSGLLSVTAWLEVVWQ